MRGHLQGYSEILTTLLFDSGRLVPGQAAGTAHELHRPALMELLRRARGAARKDSIGASHAREQVCETPRLGASVLSELGPIGRAQQHRPRASS